MLNERIAELFFSFIRFSLRVNYSFLFRTPMVCTAHISEFDIEAFVNYILPRVWCMGKAAATATAICQNPGKVRNENCDGNPPGGNSYVCKTENSHWILSYNTLIPSACDGIKKVSTDSTCETRKTRVSSVVIEVISKEIVEIGILNRHFSPNCTRIAVEYFRSIKHLSRSILSVAWRNFCFSVVPIV